MSGSQAGADPTKLQWGLNGQVGLSWPLFEGGITRAQVREQQANLNGLQAQRDAPRQQVRLEVERAQLAAGARPGLAGGPHRVNSHPGFWWCVCIKREILVVGFSLARLAAGRA